MRRIVSRLPIARFFSADKTIHSSGVNRLGSQVARTIMARMLYRPRRWQEQVPEPVHEDVRELEQEGLLVIPDFLPQSTFEQVVQRATAFWERERTRCSQVRTGASTLHALKKTDAPLVSEFPEFFEHPRLRAIMESVERRPGGFEYAHKAMELLEQGDDEGHD